MNIKKLAKQIIYYAHVNCDIWEEPHKTDKQALDNSHESYWLEFLDNGIYEKEFTENEYYNAFNLAYDIVDKGDK